MTQPVVAAGAQHSRRRKNPDLAGLKHQRHRRLGEASIASCCCDSALGFEMRVGADSPAGASAAAQALTAALPGIVAAGQPDTCLASATVSGRRSSHLVSFACTVESCDAPDTVKEYVKPVARPLMLLCSDSLSHVMQLRAHSTAQMCQHASTPMDILMTCGF